jgi:hypothetical protein
MSFTTGYNGNNLIKKAGVSQEWTLEQVAEWKKCSADPIYFIEKYVRIVTLDYGLQPMKLYDFQKEIVLAITNDNRVIANCSRQLGKSTVMAAFFCHYVIFNETKTCAILANKASLAREILSRVKLAYENLPKWLQHGIIEWNKGRIELENGSRILAAATSGTAIRGESINLLFLDEFAHISNNIAEDFFSSVYPTISSGKTSKLAIISTPNGMNHFYKMWKEAESKVNEFTPVFAAWWAIPTRDQEWADKMKAVLGDVQFEQEMCGSFIGASNTLIAGWKLKVIPFIAPIFTNSITAVYAKPVPGNKYVICVDTARGTGGDYSAFLVIDVTVLPYEVVFKYRNNTISSMLYPLVLHKAAKEYNNAYLYIENNDIGESVANALYFDLEYEDVIFSNQGEIVTWGGRNSTAGVRTTTKSKRVGCNQIKQLIEMDKLITNDAEILIEMSNFVVKGKSYEANTGNDDLMMCLVMFGNLTASVKFEEITDISVKQRIIEERRAQEEADMIPVGYYNDGIEEVIDGFVFT